MSHAIRSLVHQSPPPPVQGPHQTFQPSMSAWFETHFNHRVVIAAPGLDPETRWRRFHRVRDWLESDTQTWGVYREDWFAHCRDGRDHFYFMDARRAVIFRLSVDV